MSNPYIGQLRPGVGGGLGGLPRRTSTSASAPATTKKTFINATAVGQFAYEDTTSGQCYALNREDSPTGPALSGINAGGYLVGNSSITGGLIQPAVFGPNGNFVAVSAYYDGSNSQYYITLFSPNGTSIINNTRYYSPASVTDVAISPNGDFIVARHYSSTVTIEMLNSAGLYLGQWTVPSVSGGWTGTSFSPNGNLIVIYAGNSSSYNLHFAMYSATGVLQGSATQVSSVYTYGEGVADVSCGPNDDFVVAFADGNAPYPKFARYNSFGVLQGSVTTIEAANATRIAVKYCSNGDFVIAYCISGVGVRFGRYNSFGVLQGSLTTVENVTVSGWGKKLALDTSSSGDFTIAYSPLGANAVRYATYKSDGTLRGSITAVATIYESAPIGISYSPLNDNFIVSYQTSVNSNGSFARYGRFQNGNYRFIGIVTENASAGNPANLFQSGKYAGVLSGGAFSADFSSVGGKTISVANTQGVVA